jgi:hypothetical protein
MIQNYDDGLKCVLDANIKIEKEWYLNNNKNKNKNNNKNKNKNKTKQNNHDNSTNKRVRLKKKQKNSIFSQKLKSAYLPIDADYPCLW